MKIKQKLIDAKKSVVNFGKEHGDAIINTIVLIANTATVVGAIAYIGYSIKGSKRQVAIDIENGFMEIEGKEYKLSEDGDFITVDQWNEHTK